MREGRQLLSNLEASKAVEGAAAEDRDISQDKERVQRYIQHYSVKHELFLVWLNNSPLRSLYVIHKIQNVLYLQPLLMFMPYFWIIKSTVYPTNLPAIHHVYLFL